MISYFLSSIEPGTIDIRHFEGAKCMPNGAATLALLFSARLTFSVDSSQHIRSSA